MKQHYSKQMIIELDQSVYEEFEEYCTDAGIEKTEVMSNMVQCFMKDMMNKMDAMRKGYEEMGRINLEICSEFDGCESEAHSHV